MTVLTKRSNRRTEFSVLHRRPAAHMRVNVDRRLLDCALIGALA
jgi:hypothetical protein